LFFFFLGGGGNFLRDKGCEVGLLRSRKDKQNISVLYFPRGEIVVLAATVTLFMYTILIIYSV